MIRKADIRRVQEWMGHADIQTTMKYLHYESRPQDAQLVAEAFAPTMCPRNPNGSCRQATGSVPDTQQAADGRSAPN